MNHAYVRIFITKTVEPTCHIYLTSVTCDVMFIVFNRNEKDFAQVIESGALQAVQQISLSNKLQQVL